MKKTLVSLFFLLIAVCSLGAFSSCGKGKNKETETKEKKVNAESIDVEIFAAMPVKGDRAEYFAISGPGGVNTVKITGTPKDDGYIESGEVRIAVDLTIQKGFDEGIGSLGNLGLMLLDDNHEQIATINLSSADKDVVKAELEKETPGTINVVFSENAYDSEYNMIFKKAKFIQLVNADFTSEKELEEQAKAAEAEKAAAEKVAKKEAAEAEAAAQTYTASTSSSSSSSYDDEDDTDDYDDVDDSKSMKAAYKKAKKKVSSKAKDLKEKAAEKLNNWLDD